MELPTAPATGQQPSFCSSWEFGTQTYTPQHAQVIWPIKGQWKFTVETGRKITWQCFLTLKGLLPSHIELPSLSNLPLNAFGCETVGSPIFMLFLNLDLGIRWHPWWVRSTGTRSRDTGAPFTLKIPPLALALQLYPSLPSFGCTVYMWLFLKIIFLIKCKVLSQHFVFIPHWRVYS